MWIKKLTVLARVFYELLFEELYLGKEDVDLLEVLVVPRILVLFEDGYEGGLGGQSDQKAATM